MSGSKNCEHQNGVVECITHTLAQTKQGCLLTSTSNLQYQNEKELQQTKATLFKKFPMQKKLLVG